MPRDDLAWKRELEERGGRPWGCVHCRGEGGRRREMFNGPHLYVPCSECKGTGTDPSRQWMLRCMAISNLGETGDASNIPELEKIAQTDDCPEICEAANEAITMIKQRLLKEKFQRRHQADGNRP